LKKKFAKKIGEHFWLKLTASFYKKIEHKVGFGEKRTIFFPPKIGKNRR
jgi:hypothetical protein